MTEVNGTFRAYRDGGLPPFEPITEARVAGYVESKVLTGPAEQIDTERALV